MDNERQRIRKGKIMSNCKKDKVQYQDVVKSIGTCHKVVLHLENTECSESLLSNSERMFMITEDNLRDIIFEVLQKKTDLSPWNRAVEFIEELKAKV